MTFNRNKFQGAKISSQAKLQKTTSKNTKRLFGKTTDYVGMHKIEEGKNEFRIAPPHPEPADQPSYQAMKVSNLPIMQDVWENNEKTDKRSVRIKKIFNAVQHGGLSADPVEIYIKYLNDIFSETQSKEDQKTITGVVKGYRSDKWHWGILPMLSYVAYAWDKEGELKRLDLREAWVKQMDKIAAELDEEDEAMVIDPFTDPDTGMPLVIRQNSKAKETRDKFTLSAKSLKKGQTWEEYYEENRLSDAQLEDLMKKKSLNKLYVNCYKRRDWDLAIEGLQRIDDNNGFRIFDNEDFMSELEDLEKEVPTEEVEEGTEGDSTEETTDKVDAKVVEKPTKKEVSKKEVVKKEAEDVDVVKEVTTPKLTLPKMLKALKSYVTEVYGEEYLSQLPKGKVNITLWYDKMSNDDDLPIVFGDDNDEVIESPVEEEKVTEKITKKSVKKDKKKVVKESPAEEIVDKVEKPEVNIKENTYGRKVTAANLRSMLTKKK